MTSHRRTLKRIETAGHARFLTFSCYHRLPLFNEYWVRDDFVRQLGLVQSRFGFDMYAWVVMPDHVHLILMPHTPELTVTTILRSLKRPFSRRVLDWWRKERPHKLELLTDSKGQPHFWQLGGGYDRNIISDKELIEKSSYVLKNPIRRGLVERADRWTWSSASWDPKDTGFGPTLAPLPI